MMFPVSLIFDNLLKYEIIISPIWLTVEIKIVMIKVGKSINESVKNLIKGEIVCIPTETVYGLGVNALDQKAVDKVFKLKKRPYFDPLICHTNSIEKVKMFVINFPRKAEILAKKFWHGIVGSSSENYTTIYPPSSPINNINEGHKTNKDLNDKYFSIIEFSPINMNVLQLSRDGHIRANFNKVNNEWEGSFIVP